MSGLNSNTKLLTHFNGQNGGKEIIDDGDTGHIVSQVATAELSTAEKKFESSSLLLDGNSDYCTIVDSNDFDYDNDFTIDLWFNLNSLPSGTSFHEFWSHQTINVISSEFMIRATGGNILLTCQIFNTSTVVQFSSSAISINTGEWHHVAFVRSGNDYKIFYDGTEVGSDSSSSTVPNFSNPVNIGRRQSNNDGFFDGYIDELRFSNTARWTSNFTPSIGEYTSDSNTKLLLHLNSHDVSGDGGSNLFHIPTFFGTAQLDTSNPKFSTASILLDGNSDYVEFPDSEDWDVFGSLSDDWTVDCWIYFDARSGSPYIISQQENNTSSLWRMAWSNGDSAIDFLVRNSSGTVLLDLTSSTNLSLNTWHHVAMVKVGSSCGLYINGTQEAFGTLSGTDTFNTVLTIGRRESGADSYFDGNIDEVRIQNSNDFNASPNVGLTDSISVPTSEYSTATPPDAPTNLSASAISQTEIDLSWDAPTGPSGVTVAGYKIERESPEGGGFSVLVADTGNTNTTYSDTGLTGNTEYNYRVSAISTESVTGNPSNEAKDTTDPVVPTAPQNLTVSVGVGEQLILDWDAPSDNGGSAITGYKIERESPTGGGFSTLVADTGTSSTTYTDNSVTCGVEYNYRVSAINSVGTGPVSNTNAVVVNNSSLYMPMDSDFSDQSGIHSPSSANGASIDNSVFKFGGGSGKFDGINDRVFISSATAGNSDLDIFNSTSDNVTVSFFVKHVNTSGRQPYLIKGGSFALGGNGTWGIGQADSGTPGIEFYKDNTSQQVFALIAAGAISDTNWHHIAVIRIGANIGIYLDGVQIYYLLSTQTNTINSDFRLNYDGQLTNYLNGNLDDVFIGRNNFFNASPNVGLTDTITVPTSALTNCAGGEQIEPNLHFDKFNGKFRKIKSSSKNFIFDYFRGRHYRRIRGD